MSLYSRAFLADAWSQAFLVDPSEEELNQLEAALEAKYGRQKVDEVGERVYKRKVDERSAKLSAAGAEPSANMAGVGSAAPSVPAYIGKQLSENATSLPANLLAITDFATGGPIARKHFGVSIVPQVALEKLDELAAPGRKRLAEDPIYSNMGIAGKLAGAALLDPLNILTPVAKAGNTAMEIARNLDLAGGVDKAADVARVTPPPIPVRPDDADVLSKAAIVANKARQNDPANSAIAAFENLFKIVERQDPRLRTALNLDAPKAALKQTLESTGALPADDIDGLLLAIAKDTKGMSPESRSAYLSAVIEEYNTPLGMSSRKARELQGRLFEIGDDTLLGNIALRKLDQLSSEGINLTQDVIKNTNAAYLSGQLADDAVLQGMKAIDARNAQYARENFISKELMAEVQAERAAKAMPPVVAESVSKETAKHAEAQARKFGFGSFSHLPPRVKYMLSGNFTKSMKNMFFMTNRSNRAVGQELRRNYNHLNTAIKDWSKRSSIPESELQLRALEAARIGYDEISQLPVGVAERVYRLKASTEGWADELSAMMAKDQTTRDNIARDLLEGAFTNPVLRAGNNIQRWKSLDPQAWSNYARDIQQNWMPEKTAAEIEQWMTEIVQHSDGVMPFWKGKTAKQLPVEGRPYVGQALGEVENPLVSWVNNAYKLHNELVMRKLADSFSTEAIESGMLTKAGQGMGFEFFRRYAGEDLEFAGVAAEALSKEFSERLFEHTTRNMGDFKFLSNLASGTRGLVTLGNFPASYHRNFGSTWVSAAMSGMPIFQPFRMVPEELVPASMKGMSNARVTAKIMKDSLMLEGDDDVAELSKFFVMNGIIGDSARSRDATSTLVELGASVSDKTEAEIVKMLTSDPVSGVGAKKDQLVGWASKLYTLGDDAWRPPKFFWEFTQLKNAYTKAGHRITPELVSEFIDKAARYTSDELPTYSQSLQLAHSIKKNPIVGPFPVYEAEVMRNVWNIFKHSMDELRQGHAFIKNGDKALGQEFLKMGAKRMARLSAGVTSQLTLQGAARMSKMMIPALDQMGIGGDVLPEDIAYLVPEFDQYGAVPVRFSFEKDKNGKPVREILYLSTSFNLPTGNINKLAGIATNDDLSVGQKLLQGVAQFASPFVSFDVAVAAGLEAAKAMEESRRRPGGDPVTAGLVGVGTFASEVAPRPIKGMIKGGKELATTGKIEDFSVLKTISKTFGFRFSSVNVDEQIGHKLGALGSNYNDYHTDYNSAMEDGGMTEAQKNQQRRDLEQKLLSLEPEYAQAIAVARRMKVSDQELIDMLVRRGLNNGSAKTLLEDGKLLARKPRNN